MKRTKKPDALVKGNKTGPKSQVTPEIIEQIYKFNLLGLTHNQIAHHFGVHRDTLSHWKRTIPEVQAAFDQGGQYADADMAKMLWKVGMGEVEHPAVKFFKVRRSKKIYDDEGNVIEEQSWDEIKQVPYTKRYQPDTKAIIKWLGVRNRKTWGEAIKVEHDHRHAHLVTNDIDVTHIMKEIQDRETYSEEELKLIAKMGLNELAQQQEIEMLEE